MAARRMCAEAICGDTGDVTGPVIAVGVAVLAALAMIVVLVRRHVPAEGLVPWIREAYRSVREERRNKATDDAAASSGQEAGTGHVADLLEMGESGPAYHQAVDLREFIERRRPTR